MTQQLADDWQAKTTAGPEAGISMAEIVKADSFKPCTPCNRLPWTFQISARLLGIVARHYIRAELIDAGEHCHCRSVQDHGLPAGLGVGEEKQAPFQVHVLPL